MDFDDVGFGIILPWQLWLVIIACLIGYAIYYNQLPFEEKEARCLKEIHEINREGKFTKDLKCLVQIAPGKFQKIDAFKKSGIVEE